jgi:hypothetical protein
MATREELEAAVAAANDPAIALPEYQAVKQARAALDAAEAEVERLEDVWHEAYRVWGATPEYQAFLEAVKARSDWQASHLDGFLAICGIWQTPQEREAS